jgi:hypothetical protein
MFVYLQYLRDYPTFIGTARYWTETFAKRGSLGIQEKVHPSHLRGLML